MLFLDHANDIQFTAFDEILYFLVPDWHMLATTRSPGGKLNEQRLLASRRRQQFRLRPRCRDGWQRKVDMGLPDLRLVGFRCRQRRPGNRESNNARQSVEQGSHDEKSRVR